MVRLAAESSTRWQPGAPADTRQQNPWPTALGGNTERRGPWAAAKKADSFLASQWIATKSSDQGVAATWCRMHQRDSAETGSPWAVSRRCDLQQQFDAVGLSLLPSGDITTAPWGNTAKSDASSRISGVGLIRARPLYAARLASWRKQLPVDILSWIPWGMGRHINTTTVVVVVDPLDPNEPGAPVIIPTLRAYIVINSASLARVSNNLALPVTSLSISIDDDSAHWTWSATLPLRSLADLEPNSPGELVELEAIVNGFPWRLLVERKGEKERFGSASLSIGGRGIAAELSDPTYPIVSHDNVAGAMTAQQLAAAALSINGVPLGWSLDWQAADWLVPAGAWVHSGTPLDAVVRIAAAAGAYVQAAPGSRALRVVPRYPVAPWEWSSATPALVLPASAVMERGTDHVNRAAYNVVYVSGQAGGVLARVKRVGSAGDRAAQMIVDGLITHADAARGRGLEVLGNTGAQQIVSLETGILPASGVIHVGTLMDWTRGADARRGMVRSLSVTASVPTGTSKDPVKVRQTIGVEIHG